VTEHNTYRLRILTVVIAALTLLLFIAAWRNPDVLELSAAAFALALAFGIYLILQKR
jgi:uncharacterized membrane protein